MVPFETRESWWRTLGLCKWLARNDAATDEWVLNGTKIYITNGPVADVLLVYAKTDKHYVKKFEAETNITGYAKFVRVTAVTRILNSQFDYKIVTVTVTHPSYKGPIAKTTAVSRF